MQMSICVMSGTLCSKGFLRLNKVFIRVSKEGNFNKASRKLLESFLRLQEGFKSFKKASRAKESKRGRCLKVH